MKKQREIVQKMSKKILLILAIYFGFACPEVFARTQKLSPQEFSNMYSLASNGKLGSLQAAASRGLNLNAQNYQGDSGICVAIKSGDILAYNTFIKAGAHIHPPCMNYISQAYIDNFISQPQVIKYSEYPTSFHPRESNDWFIVGGVAAVVGGIVWMMTLLAN